MEQMITCSKCKTSYPATKEYFYKDPYTKDKLCYLCKTCKKNRVIPADYVKYRKKYYEANKEKLKEIQKNKYKNKPGYKEYAAEYQRKRFAECPELKSIYRNKRNSNKKKLISNYTVDNWNECKNFFNNKCSYCGESLLEITQDHIVPVSKGGHYIKQNIIPACKSCNSSKNNSDMETWYKKQPFFSKEKLNKIYQWIEVDNGIQQIKII